MKVFYFCGVVGDEIGVVDDVDDVHLSTHARPQVEHLFALFFTEGATRNKYSAGIFIIADRDHVFVATEEPHGFGSDQVALFLPIDVEVAFFKVFEGLGVCIAGKIGFEICEFFFCPRHFAVF